MTDLLDHSWQTMTTAEAKDIGQADPVVILPIAAIEQHGPHLPLSTDLDIGIGILDKAFTYLPLDFPVWVLPTQVVGTSAEHLTFPGTLSIDANILSDLIWSQGKALTRSGIRRLLVTNSHGGNRQAIDTAALRLRRELGLLVIKSNYFLLPRPAGVTLPDAEWRHGLHGGALETAMMLHLKPDLVRTKQLPDAPSLGRLLEQTLNHVDTTNEGASLAWLAEDLHFSGVAGNSTLATASIGKHLVDGYGRMLSEIIQDTKYFPLDRLMNDDRAK